MSEILKGPCSACPYRQDCPSGVWVEHEYNKLVDYDRPTSDQPLAVFGCHASPDKLCHGWAVCHSNRGREYELLALRVWPPSNAIPEPKVPLFASGAEAAEHGKKDINKPKKKAKKTVGKLLKKHRRLRNG